jgi:hypothetical protein
MARVSIRYQNGTTVEANNLGDALVHLMHQGTDYVTDVVTQDSLARVTCDKCDGAGVLEQEPVVVLTAEEIAEKVAAVDEAAPRVAAVDNFDERVKAARRVAKED